MWKKIFFAALAVTPPSSLLADTSLDHRLERTEKRLEQLENQVRDQESEERENGSDKPWYKHFEVSGVIEIEAVYEDPESADSESDLTLTTAELGIAIEINPKVAAEIVLLYEEDGEEELDVDVAAISLLPSQSWSITAGQFYVPFGLFETQMVSDPLTLELGETRESALAASFSRGGIGVTAYLFDGDASEDGDSKIDNFGVELALAQEHESFSYSAHLGYTNDIGDSDRLIDYAGEVHERVAGLSVSLMLSTGPFTLIGEYVGAVDEFDATGEEPSAHNLELGYNFTLAGIEANAAIGLQRTDDALGVALPEEVVVAALRIEPIDEIYLALEYANLEDYSDSQSDQVTFLIAAEF
jgi:hypothetical protein